MANSNSLLPQFEDPVLNKLDPPMPVLESTKNVFHDLMSCIIEQQIHYRSSKGLFQKRLDDAGMAALTPGNFDRFAPSLARIKLSQRKHETVALVLDFFQQNQIDWLTLADNEVRSTLATIKGVGEWTIDMILLYTLERPDVFPAGDYHVKKIMCSLYGIEQNKASKKAMMAVAESWRPYRSYAVMKLLAWKDWQKQGIRTNSMRSEI